MASTTRHPPLPSPARNLLPPLAVGLAALAIQLPLYRRWISFFDEALIAQVADELNHGLVLYRDTAHPAFPGIFYATAALFRLTGPNLLAGRAVMAVMFVIMALLVYRLTRLVAGPAAALAAGLAFALYRPWAFPHWQMLSYSPPAIVAVTAALLACLHATTAGSRPGLVLAGLLFGTGMLFKQDYGGYTLVAANLFLAATALPPVRKGRRAVLGDLGALDLGAALPIIAVLIALAAAGALRDFAIQTIAGPLIVHPFWSPGSAEYPSFFGLFPLFGQNPRLHGPQMFSYLPSLLLELHWRDIAAHPLFRETPVVDLALKVVYLLPYVLLVLAAVGLVARGWHARKAEAVATGSYLRELGVVTVLGGLLASYNKPRDWVHLMILYYPTFVLGALLASRLARRGARWRALIGASTVLAGACLTASSLWLVRGAARTYDTPLPFRRAPLQVRADEATLLRQLVDYLGRRAPARAPLLVLPYYPLLNFITGRPGVSRFRTVVPVEPYADRDEQVIAALEAHPDAIVLYAYTQVMSLPRFPEYAPELHRYLLAHYRLSRSFSASPTGYLFGLLVRRGPTPPPAIDLTARLDDATVTEQRGGNLRILPANERPDAVRRARWSYLGPLIAVRPLAGGERIVRFRVSVPPRAHLKLRAGVNPDLWNTYPAMPVRFTVRIRTAEPAAAAPARTWKLHLDPQHNVADRRWAALDMDLSALAGRRAEIELGVGAESHAGERLDLAGFEEPRLVVEQVGQDDPLEGRIGTKPRAGGRPGGRRATATHDPARNPGAASAPGRRSRGHHDTRPRPARQARARAAAGGSARS